MNSTSEGMDAKRLASITAEAVSSVLLFHTKRITPSADIRRSGLEHAVNAVFHLRSRAADMAVADLEIACDAALSYAHDYNELHPDNTINDRWMYLCIQALLSNRLKPALMEEGKVQRLRQWVAEQRDGVRADVSDAELDEDPTLSSVELLSSPDQTEQVDVTIVSDEYEDDNDDDSDDEDEQEVSSYVPVARLAEAKGRSTLAVKESKMPWTDADIRHMIELRAQGFTHLETAARLGRGKGAVENKYGRVVKETAWKPYVATCETRFVKIRGSKRKVPSEWDDEDELETEARTVVKKAARRMVALE